jgi:lipoic acid synthetase
VTYHGPGQLVGYPIVSLRERRLDIHAYVDRLEEVLLRTLAGYGVRAAHEAAHPGVWYGGEQLAALGLGVKHGVALHGFALNVAPDLAPFSLINPCGSGRRVTSLARILGRAPPLEAVAEALTAHFDAVFGMRMAWDRTPVKG